MGSIKEASAAIGVLILLTLGVFYMTFTAAITGVSIEELQGDLTADGTAYNMTQQGLENADAVQTNSSLLFSIAPYIVVLMFFVGALGLKKIIDF